MIPNDIVLAGSQKSIRFPISNVQMAFAKEFDPDIKFLTYDAGEDYDDMNIYASTDSDVLQEWDKYEYIDYSSRVIYVDTYREKYRPHNISLASANVIFNNTDGFFDTDNELSPLYPNVSPGRPIRIQLGFENGLVRQFTGLSDGMPKYDDAQKTVSFYFVDYLYWVLYKDLAETVMLVDKRVDEILEYIFLLYGLSTDQLDLEESALTIPFFYAEKGTVFFQAIKQLIEAEVGSLYMDETGMICFRRQGTGSDDVVAELSTSDSIKPGSYKRRNVDLYNNIKISSTVRKVASNRPIFELGTTEEVPAGGTIDIWADFQDPVVTVDAPTYGSLGSVMTVNTAEDGSGSDSTDVVLDSFYQFGTSYKMTFSNPTGSPLYITSLVLFGTPALAQDPIYVEYELESSVEKYGRYPLEIISSYIGSEANAQLVASVLFSQFGNYSGLARLLVKGTPQFQIDDVIEVDWYGKTRLCRIVAIENQLDKTGFNQILEVADQVSSPFMYYDSEYNYDDGNIYGL